MTSVLEGIRILDLSRYIAGPVACALMADAGAEVIRVESPVGEEDRNIGTMSPSGQPLWFSAWAHHKKSVAIDIRSDAGLAELDSLARISDAVVHSFAPGSPQAEVLAYERLDRLNPSIVVAAISAFGQTGPYASKIGFDFTVQAIAGLMDLTGDSSGPPMRSGIALADFLSGHSTAYGMMLALFERARSGRGQLVDVSLLDNSVFPVIAQGMVSEHRLLHQSRRRLGNKSWYSFVDAFEAKDGTVVLCPAIEPQWRRMARAIGRPDLLEDPRFDSNLARFEHRDALSDIVGDWVRERSTEEVVTAMDEARVPCSPVLGIAEMTEHPQIRARDMLVELGKPGQDAVTVPGFPIKLSRTPATVEGPAPDVGEHNEWAFSELLGLDAQTIARREAL